VIKKVELAGFEIIRVSGFVSVLFPLMLLNRRGKSELKINRPLNAVVEKLLSFERLIILSRTSFPWGESLLLVAGKA